MALVTFHRREKENIDKSDAPVEYLEKLGGSYDFGLKNNSSDFVFDENTLNAVIEFITKNNFCGVQTNSCGIQTEEKHVLGR